jgi:hypothetical protein
MTPEEDRELWELLASGPKPELSDFFARNVIRRVRQQPRRFEWVGKWLAWRRLVPASVVAIAVAGAIVFTGRHSTAPSAAADTEPAVVAKVDPQDYDVVADLDQLLAADEKVLWDDDQTL